MSEHEHEAKKASIVVFSGDMDKVMAAFIIATTAAASGIETTMFFTFWGLQALKKKVPTGRTLFERMLSMFLKDINGIGPSKLNMGGMDLRFFKVTVTTPIRYIGSKKAIRQSPFPFVPEKR
jgi:peroxiredoxin family protein